MTGGIVQSQTPVTLLGAGDAGAALVRDALATAPLLVAADGGANKARALGLRPAAVIGDMDSVLPATRQSMADVPFHHVAEQDSTDFEKALTRIGAPFVLAVGFTGARVDHALAVWNALVRHPDRRCVVLGARDIVFLSPRRIALDLAAGTRLSLFPMGPVRGRSRGLVWPIDGIGFASDGAIGTSNQATGPVELEFDAARMLAILPRRTFARVLPALKSAWGG